MDALRKAITIFGTQEKLAEALHVGQPAVGMWIVRGRIPAAQAVRIEQLTSGKVTMRELCPELFERRKAKAA